MFDELIESTSAESRQSIFDSLSHYSDEDSKRTKDIFGTIYVIAKLYTMGYEMTRPYPGNWDSALGDVVMKMNAIQKAIGTLSNDILRIQEAIQNLPTVINGVVETQLIRNALRDAAGRASLLRTYMASEGMMKRNFSEIQRINNDLIVNLNSFSDWYSDNQNGALSFLVTMGPLMSTCNLCYNFVQVQLWAQEHSNHTGDYPLNSGEISNYTDLGYMKVVQKAYSEVISATEIAYETFAEDAKSVFPWMKPTAESALNNDFHFYTFENNEFSLSAISAVADFPPKRKYDELLFGQWQKPTNNSSDPTISLLWTGYEWALTGQARFRSLGSLSNREMYERAKLRGFKIAKAQYEISRYGIIGQELDKHKEILKIINSGSIWSAK